MITVPDESLILRLNGILRGSHAGWVAGDPFTRRGDQYHPHRGTPADFERLLAQHLQITHRGPPV